MIDPLRMVVCLFIGLTAFGLSAWAIWLKYADPMRWWKAPLMSLPVGFFIGAIVFLAFLILFRKDAAINNMIEG